MKSRIRKPSALSWNTWWNEGLRLLGERLGIPLPSNASAEEITRWRDEIAQALIEEQPEFGLEQKGPGRPLGSKTKHLNPSPGRDAERKRRQRQRQAKAPWPAPGLVDTRLS